MPCKNVDVLLARYHNSIYDLPANIGASYPDDVNTTDEQYNYVTDVARQLAKVANVTAHTLYELSRRGEEAFNVTVNETVVANLLYCFLHDPQHCELIQSVLDEDNARRFSESRLLMMRCLVKLVKLTAYVRRHNAGAA